MDIERVILYKPLVKVFANIPPIIGGRGYRADSWELINPNWTGRLRVLTCGYKCVIRLEDKATGQLFAECPVDNYPSPKCVEDVIDSSRYFVIKIVNGLDHAFVGMGFDDRADSFDFRVALQEHFRQLNKDQLAEDEIANPEPSKDYRLKEGQTIKIDIKNLAKQGTGTDISWRTQEPTSKAVTMSGGVLLPPPSIKKVETNMPASSNNSNMTATPFGPPTVTPNININPFGDLDPFTSTTTDTEQTTDDKSNNNWVTF